MNDPLHRAGPADGQRKLPSRIRQHAPKALFAVACGATLVAALVVVENRWDARAQDSGVKGIPAAKERAAADRLIPKPVPDEQNFAATPFFASLFDKTLAGAAAPWPDDFSEADRWPRRWPTLAESDIGRKTGRLVTDHLAWQKAFEQFRHGISDEEIVVSDSPDPATNRLAAIAVLKELKPYEEVLRELASVRHRPFSRFQVQYDVEKPWGILLPHLAVLKRTSQLLRLKASGEIAAGNPTQAMEDLLLLLRVVEAPRTEPILISQLVRAAMFDIAMHPLWEGLAARSWSDAQLQALQAELQRLNFISDLRFAYEAERAWCNVIIGEVRDRREPGVLGQLLDIESRPEAWLREAETAFATAPSEWFALEQDNCEMLFDTRLLTSMDPVNRQVFPEVADEHSRFTQSLLKESADPLKEHLVFARILVSGITRGHLKFAYAQGVADLATVACALERFRLASGQYPAELAELAPRFLQRVPHDVTTGEPLKYSRTATGNEFLLYSVGWNLADEQGRVALFESGRGPERKEGDWVWRYPGN